MPSASDHLSVYECINDACEWYRRKRRVRRQYLGAGLYLDATLVCECGHAALKMEIEFRPAKS